MDHKAFLAQLPQETRARLTQSADAPGLWHLSGHLGAIAIMAALVALRVPFWPVLMLPLGIAWVFLFTLLHETCHKIPFASEWLNVVVGHFCGFALFLPANWFRYFHFAHHRFTRIPGQDPELDSPKPDTWAQYLWYLTGVALWREYAATLLANAMGRGQARYIPAARDAGIAWEARAYLLGYAVLLGVSLWAQNAVLLFVWLVPLVLGQPFLRLNLMAEHGRCAFVVNMLENTRTTYTNRLVRALAWNMPYHAEHHSYPTVPFPQLPALHALMQPHLAVTAAGYSGFHREYQAGLGREGAV